jgi:hypothetical protein
LLQNVRRFADCENSNRTPAPNLNAPLDELGASRCEFGICERIGSVHGIVTETDDSHTPDSAKERAGVIIAYRDVAGSAPLSKADWVPGYRRGLSPNVHRIVLRSLESIRIFRRA